MAGHLSEYAYGKIKIRVMKVNRERFLPILLHCDLPPVSAALDAENATWHSRGARAHLSETRCCTEARRAQAKRRLWLKRKSLMVSFFHRSGKHDVHELTVKTLLYGDFADSWTTGSNTKVKGCNIRSKASTY